MDAAAGSATIDSLSRAPDVVGEMKEIDSFEKPQSLYRCKRCRRIVASQENVVPHQQGQGEQCFRWNKRDNYLKSDEKPECSSIFVERMKWMQAVEEGHVEEKLCCIGCNARLGSFNWAGMQCSCGAWVNPAFQLQKSRVDESTIFKYSRAESDTMNN